MGVKFEDHSDEVKNGLLETQKKALREVGRMLKKASKEAVPVKTGALKASISTWVRVNKKTGQAHLELGVYSNKAARKKGLSPVGSRAHLTEFGTSKARGKSFLKAPTLALVSKIRDIEIKHIPELKHIATFQDTDEEITDD